MNFGLKIDPKKGIFGSEGTEVISSHSFDNDIVRENMQGLGLRLNYMNTTSSLLPIIVCLCTNNVIKRFLVAVMSCLTVIELLFYLTWTKSTECSISW